jgi:hypothetical protein
MTEELAGQSGKNETAAASKAADAAAKDAATTKTLKTYADTETK